jgi:hypothetical protein
MKKVLSILAFVVLLSSSAYPFRLGLEFQATADNHNDLGRVAVNMRLNDLVELKPMLGFKFSENNNRFSIGMDGNFYLPPIQDLQHYAGPGLAFDAFPNGNTFQLHGQYGLRYDFNEILSTFGEIGVGMDFDPFVFGTFRGAVGLTIFFPTFQ